MSPAYVASRVRDPAESDGIEKVAAPPLNASVSVVVPSIVTVTFPVGVPPAPETTVTVADAVSPYVIGAEVIDVVVGACAIAKE